MDRLPALTRLRKRVGANSWLDPAKLLVAMGAVFCLLIVAATVRIALVEREGALRHTSTNLTNLALALADKVDGLIASLEIAEERLVDHLALEPGGAQSGRLPVDSSSQRLHELLLDVASGLPDAYELGLIDANGALAGVSVAFPTPRRSLADRAYFQFAKAHPEVRSFVSEPVISRQSGHPIFLVVRRLSATDGSFRGVVIAAVDASYLSRRSKALRLGEGSTISLLRRDGLMLVREPSLPLETMLARQGELRALIESVGEAETKRLVGIDGVDRFASFVALPRYGLMLAVSQPYGSVLSVWRTEMFWLALVAFLICCAVATTVVLALRGLRNQQRMETMEAARQLDAERLQAERVIAAQNARFALAVDTMGHGLMMYTRDDHLVFANAAACKILGVPDGAFRPGMTLTEAVQILASAEINGSSVEATVERYREIMRKETPEKYTRVLPDGRQLAVCFVPYADGSLFSFEDVTEIRRIDARIAHMAHHDALTDLPNRFELRNRKEKALQNVTAEPFALMCLDLDHFKGVNDTLGHPAGDKLLREVVARIHTVIRDTDTVARLGGDEFAIIARPFKGRDGIARMADRLIRTVSEPFSIDGQIVYVGVSIGIAVAPDDSQDPDILMKQADLALYRAKKEGRGRHRFFVTAMEQQAADRQRIEAEMHAALAQGHFVLHYQPVVGAVTRRVAGYEALLRWHHPERGMISPGAFVPVAEENGMIVRIGAWALHAACQTAMSWPSELKVAVNLSPVQFLDGALVETVSAALTSSGLAPSRLELEITESTMMHDIDLAVATLTELKGLGVSIAMDDFGTGHSSLAHLRRFPFDKLKIDQAFIRDIAQNQNVAILQAIIHIAQSMGIRTTAEGIETEAQLAEVIAAGCDEWQGYLFSKPLPAGYLLEAVARIDGCDFAPGTIELVDSVCASMPAARAGPGISRTGPACGQASCLTPLLHGEAALQ